MTSVAINEGVLKFANVNGSGSASANGLLAKAIFRMGVPIGPKNIFPSNIQGLPTWYEIRVSARGFLGRRGGVDLMVAMNPQSLPSDIAEVVSGGAVLLDSTRPLAKELRREDVRFIEIPITALCAQEFPNAKDRSLLKNVVYVGAVMALLGVERDTVVALLKEQYGKKPALLEANIKALELGAAYAIEHLSSPGLSIRIERMVSQAARGLDAGGPASRPIMIDGNTAAALGCIYAGATVAAWYPITPSTSLVDAFDRYCHKLRIDPATQKKRFAILQAEDELCAVGVVLGAAWNGARAFTATSGPGISLMTEFLGLAYYAEIPAVIFDIQRVGPSTGMPTRTQQSDLLACAYASHGDTHHILLFPATPAECFEFAAMAFDLADRFQTPVIVLSDINLGMNEWMSGPLTWRDDYVPDRGKVVTRAQLDAGAKFFRYLDKDGDGVCERTYPGTHPARGSYFTRGSGHDKLGRYTEDPALYQENLDRLRKKFVTAAGALPRPEITRRSGAKLSLVYWGTTAEAIPEALEILKARHGIECQTMRVRGFPWNQEIEAFCSQEPGVCVIEQSRDGQLRSLLMTELDLDPKRLASVRIYDGQPIAAELLAQRLAEVWEGLKGKVHVSA